MKKASHYLSAMLMVACFTQPATAQFEGEITYNSYDYAADGTEQKKDEFTMFVTSDRILLQGDKKYDFMGSIKTEGVLVRLDFQDFVFLTGEEQALKIAKSDITSMMKMFNNGNGTSTAEEVESINYERADGSKTIQGYQCEKFIFRDEENENDHTVVWMTKGIDVNWGMLSEPWGNKADQILSEFPMDLVFKEKYFPVRVEGYENDRMTSLLEATKIESTPVARAMVQVPSGIKVLSFQDYLFQKMSEQ